MNIDSQELNLLRKACRGGKGDVAEYLKFTGKDSICYADEVVRLANAYEEATWSLQSAIEAAKHPLKRIVAAFAYVVQRCGRAEASMCVGSRSCSRYMSLTATQNPNSGPSWEPSIVKAAMRASAQMLGRGQSDRLVDYLGKKCANLEKRDCIRYNEQENVLCTLEGQLTAARRSLGGQAKQDEYINFFAKKLSDAHFVLHLKYGYPWDDDCTPEGQLQKAIEAVNSNRDGDEYIFAR